MKINVKEILFNDPDFQQYKEKDSSLINSIVLQRKFGLPEDYIELHVYDLNDVLLKSNYNYKGYKSSLPSPNNLLSNLNIDPAVDVSDLGYKQGSVKAVYNTFRNIFGGGPSRKFFIKTISTDRTELRITNNDISNNELEKFYNTYLTSFISEAFYKDFYLNFGGDNLIIGINAILEQDPDQYNLLIKLYEPLPLTFGLKDQFWIVDKLSDPNTYQVDFILESTDFKTEDVFLRGPNFNLNINNEVNPSVEYKTYEDLISNSSTSSYQQLKSLLEEKNLEINVDYSEYENFVHFSSVKERLLNFVYKLKLIENYQLDLEVLGTSTNTPQISSSKAILSNNINNVIEKFDGYEYYLYYESGSKTWPKKNNEKPLINYEITASEAITWLGSDDDNNLYYGGELYSASIYDNNNQDNLFYTIPEYLRIDPENQGYETFFYMIGQHFDNIWLYAKAVTDLYDSNNNPDMGISKDLVAYALKSLGIKLYSNTNASNDVFSYLLGVTPSGSNLYSTGSENITTYVTASNESLAGSSIDKEVYKRLYHNLPYLLKTKGTERGLRALMACYGIPDTILRVNEFGGTDKDSGSIEQFYDRVGYALDTKTGSVNISTFWAPTVYQNIQTASGNIVPDTIEFRFKTKGIPPISHYTQSLFQIASGSDTQFGIQLLFTSESNSGSYNDYGDIRLIMSSSISSSGYVSSDPIHLPFFDGGWWNVMVLRETGSILNTGSIESNTYSIYAANSIYNGHDGDGIGFIGSASMWPVANYVWESSSFDYSFSGVINTSIHYFLLSASLFPSGSVLTITGSTIINTGTTASVLVSAKTSVSSDTSTTYFFENSYGFGKVLSASSAYEFDISGSAVLGDGYDRIVWLHQLDASVSGSSHTTSIDVNVVRPSEQLFNAWNSYNTSSVSTYLGGENNSSSISPDDIIFSGSFQELRYWVEPLSQYNFINHTLNPLSYESKNLTASYNNLIFRVPLGADLVVSSDPTVYSVHPTFGKTGSFITNSGTASYATVNVSSSDFLSSSYGVTIYGGYYFGTSSLDSTIYNADSSFYYLNAGNFGLSKPTNNKIRIPTADIVSGSTLSPFVKMEQNPEIALTKDTNVIEVAISPQDQINTDIINQLGYFDIDEYIGDPREATGSVYNSLEELKKTYFQKYVNSYNYFDLIRIVKYYNNSLFKMVRDFTPARSNISTGIVIKSHILERSKHKRFNPDVTSSIQEGSMSMVSVDGDNGGSLKSSYSYSLNDVIHSLSGSVLNSFRGSWPKFTGELSGSTLVITSQSLDNYNYSNDQNHYLHSNYNILLNNVSQSRKSHVYSDVDYSTDPNIATNLGLIQSGSSLIHAEVQDSNYTLLRNINPRYKGSKIISQLYNDFTEGDTSYGQTAAIDKHVKKIGVFTNITSSKFIPNRSQVQLKYLIDEDGNLTELNTQNDNWFEVQNTFILGKNTNVAQFDPLKYGDQKTLDGFKSIYNSGYKYSPTLYFTASEDYLIFNGPPDTNVNFQANNTASDYLTGSDPFTASMYGSEVVDVSDNWYMEPTKSFFQAGVTGKYSFNYSFTMNAVSVQDKDTYGHALTLLNPCAGHSCGGACVQAIDCDPCSFCATYGCSALVCVLV